MDLTKYDVDDFVWWEDSKLSSSFLSKRTHSVWGRDFIDGSLSSGLIVEVVPDSEVGWKLKSLSYACYSHNYLDLLRVFLLYWYAFWCSFNNHLVLDRSSSCIPGVALQSYILFENQDWSLMKLKVVRCLTRVWSLYLHRDLQLLMVQLQLQVHQQKEGKWTGKVNFGLAKACKSPESLRSYFFCLLIGLVDTYLNFLQI